MIFSIFIQLYLLFGSDMLSLCIPFKLYMGKHVSRENLSNILFKRKQLCCENSFCSVFIIVRGINPSLSPLITICYSPFSFYVYLVDDISFRLYFKQVYFVGERLFCYTLLISCTCLIFHPCLVSHLLAMRPTNVTLVNE